jgi:hypothetical protein
MVRYPYSLGQKLYEVHLSVSSPTYLLLPPGERLASTVKVDPERWDITHVQMGEDDTRQETVVLRALAAPQQATTAPLFQSGLIIFLKLIGTEDAGMIAVTWDLPALPQPPPAPPLDQRPPPMDTSRIHLAYRLKEEGGITPPWLPRTIFDDGVRTFVQLPDLQGQPVPAVFAQNQTGQVVLTPSRLFTRPGQPEAGSWLLVQGLHPALTLKDSAGVEVTLVRQSPAPSVAQEGGPHAP